MNAYAVFVVNEHLEMLRREAAERRARSEGRPGMLARIATRLAGLRTVLTGTDAVSTVGMATLDTHPTRG